MITLPKLNDIQRIQKTEIPTDKKIKMVLDTDAYNEIDDQFAILYALLSTDRIEVQSIYAALFHNDRSSSPEDGMNKSYDEICKVLNFIDKKPDQFAFRGCVKPLANPHSPEDSEAVRDLIEKAMACSEDDPLFVVGIGSSTNIASAIITQPEIMKRIVVVWLGGNTFEWTDNDEFNLNQDIVAGKILFDCGVPMIQVPACGVTNFLATSIPELESCIGGVNPVCDYLIENVKSYHDDHFAWTKAIWDIGTIGLLVNPDFAPQKICHSPIITLCHSYSFDVRRHLIRSVYKVNRDAIFKDMFQKLRRIK